MVGFVEEIHASRLLKKKKKKTWGIEQKNPGEVLCRLCIYLIFTLLIFSPTNKTLPVDGKYVCIIFLSSVGHKRFCYITNDPKISLDNKTKLHVKHICPGSASLCCDSGTIVDGGLTVMQAFKSYKKSKKGMASYPLTLHHLTDVTNHFLSYLISQT